MQARMPPGDTCIPLERPWQGGFSLTNLVEALLRLHYGDHWVPRGEQGSGFRKPPNHLTSVQLLLLRRSLKKS